jgi:hypothetical protein
VPRVGLGVAPEELEEGRHLPRGPAGGACGALARSYPHTHAVTPCTDMRACT